jgi:hypothetical protein
MLFVVDTYYTYISSSHFNCTFMMYIVYVQFFTTFFMHIFEVHFAAFLMYIM